MLNLQPASSDDALNPAPGDALTPGDTVSQVCRLDGNAENCGCAMSKATRTIGTLPVLLFAISGLAFAGSQFWQQRDSVGQLFGLSSPGQQQSGCHSMKSGCGTSVGGCCPSTMSEAGCCPTSPVALESITTPESTSEEPTSATEPVNLAAVEVTEPAKSAE